jgi:hypothetical protein
MAERYREYLLVQPGANGGVITGVKRPEHQLGDAMHLPGGLTTEWQLRPMTAHDMIEGVSYAPGTWMLARRLPEIGGLYAYVHLPFSLRRNTPAAAAEAYRRLIARDPRLDSFYRRMEELSVEFCAEIATRNRTNDQHDQHDHGEQHMNRDCVA